YAFGLDQGCRASCTGTRTRTGLTASTKYSDPLLEDLVFGQLDFDAVEFGCDLDLTAQPAVLLCGRQRFEHRLFELVGPADRCPPRGRDEHVAGGTGGG